MNSINKKIGLVVKRDPNALKKANELITWLVAKGVKVFKKIGYENGIDSINKGENEDSLKKGQIAPSDLNFVFVLGGDGTFLSAARWIGEKSIPMMGVKFGEVGFLAEIVEKDLFNAVDAVLNNKFIVNQRMRIEVRIFRNKILRARETVLNDVVINKSALSRLAYMETSIDDKYITTYKADGLIVSTPTGSTAYSLAAGGPIIHPEVPGILLTPICPFTLTNRPLILPDSAVVSIKLAEKVSDIMVTFDGQKGVKIDNMDLIVVSKSKYPLSMITFPDQTYFDVLKKKLNWSGGKI